MASNPSDTPEGTGSTPPGSTPPPSAPSYTPQSTGGYTPQPANTATGLDPNVAGGLSYVLGWLTGLIFVFIERDRFVRFHAFQSIITFGGITVIWILMTILSAILGRIPVIDVLWWIVSLLLTFALALGGLALWIILMVMEFQGRRFKLPIIGDYAERYAESSTGQA